MELTKLWRAMKEELELVPAQNCRGKDSSKFHTSSHRVPGLSENVENIVEKLAGKLKKNRVHSKYFVDHHLLLG